MENKKSNYLALSLSSIIFLAIWYFFTTSSYNGTIFNGINSNILLYVGDIATFLISTLIFSLLFKTSKFEFLNNAIVAKWVPIVEALAVGYILIWNYLNENFIYIEDTAKGYIRHNLFPLVVIALVGLAVVFFDNITIDFKKSFKWVLATVVSLVAALCEYTPNPFADEGGTIYHIDAYTTSIFNLVNGASFSEINRCIYGHYAFFYYPLVKLFGGYQSVTIAISITAFITIFLFSISGILLLKDKKIFCLYEFSLLFLITEVNYKGVYWQCFPHRCLFPALLIFWVVFIETKGKKGLKFQLVGWIICLLSIIWNFETGLVCAVSYLIYLVVKRVNVKNIIVSLIMFVLSFAGAYGLTNALNKIFGGSILSIKEFVYPMLSDDYKIEDLAIGILSGLHTSALFTLTLVIILIVALYKCFASKGVNKPVLLILVITSLNALGVYVYGINRPAYGSLSVGLLQFIFAIAVVADSVKLDLSEDLFVYNTNYVIKKFLTIILTIISVESVVYTGITLYKKSETTWDMTNYTYIYQSQVLSITNGDVPALGMGTNILYADLGWDTQYHVSDFPDINGASLEYVNQDILNQEYIFVSQYTGNLTNLSNFDLLCEIYIGDYSYYLCRNKEYNGE